MARYRLKPGAGVPLGSFLREGATYFGIILREPVPRDPPIIRLYNPDDDFEWEDVSATFLEKLGG